MRYAITALLSLPILVAVLARTFLFETCSIPSRSMAPTLLPGDHVIVARYSTRVSRRLPERGDVVVFRSAANDQLLVKRVIAISSDEVEIREGRVRLNARTLPEPYVVHRAAGEFLPPRTLPENSYYVVGDNRADSVDSRTWGTISGEQIIGRVRFIFWSSGGDSMHDAAHAAVRTADVLGREPSGVRWWRVLRVVR